MTKKHHIVLVVLAVLGAWYLLESDIRDTCADDEACIAASL